MASVKTVADELKSNTVNDPNQTNYMAVASTMADDNKTTHSTVIVNTERDENTKCRSTVNTLVDGNN